MSLLQRFVNQLLSSTAAKRKRKGTGGKNKQQEKQQQTSRMEAPWKRFRRKRFWMITVISYKFNFQSSSRCTLEEAQVVRARHCVGTELASQAEMWDQIQSRQNKELNNDSVWGLGNKGRVITFMEWM